VGGVEGRVEPKKGVQPTVINAHRKGKKHLKEARNGDLGKKRKDFKWNRGRGRKLKGFPGSPYIDSVVGDT